MSEMIDRVALAICDAEIGLTYGPYAAFTSATDLLEETGERSAAHWRSLARAAIAIMREPTLDMVLCGGGWGMGLSYADVIVGWKAMIDEAMKQIVRVE